MSHYPTMPSSLLQIDRPLCGDRTADGRFLRLPDYVPCIAPPLGRAPPEPHMLLIIKEKKK